jgi:hypothetical protein
MLIDIRLFLAVNNDWDKGSVQDLHDVGIVEALALHHLAPVAGEEAHG